VIKMENLESIMIEEGLMENEIMKVFVIL